MSALALPDTLELAAVEAATRALEARSAELEPELDDTVRAAKARVHTSLPSILASGAELDAITRGIAELSGSVDGSAGVVERVGGQVTTIRRAQAAVGATIDLIDTLIQVEDAQAAALGALASADLEAAVSHARRLGEGAERAGEGLAPDARAAAERVQTDVRTAVADSLERALATDDAAAAGRCCALHALSGEAESAVRSYAEFIERQLRAAARPRADEADARASVPAQLSRVLHTAAAALTGADPLLSADTCPADARRRVGCAVRACAVEAGSRLASQLATACALRSMVADARRRMGKQPPAGMLQEVDADAEASILGSDGLLDTLASVVSGAVQFDAYVAKWMGGGDGGDAAGAASAAGAPGAAGVGRASLRDSDGVGELARALAALSAQHSWASVLKALHLDERRAAADTDGGRDGATELVDTIFFMLQGALRRSCRCRDGAVVAEAIRHCADLLSLPLLDYLQGLLRESISAKLAGAALAGAHAISSATTTDLAGTSLAGAAGFAVSAGGASLAGAAGLAVSAAGAARQPGVLRALNALQLCVGYCPQLWARARHDFGELSGPNSPSAEVDAELNLARRVEAQMSEALASGLAQLSATLYPRLKPRLDALGSRNYERGAEIDAEMADAGADDADGALGALAAELGGLVGELQPALTEENVDSLYATLVRAIAERLEALLLQKRVDRVGALAVDADVRALSGRLSELSKRSVRDKLSRLTQISAILSLDAEAEVAELWSLGTLRLSAEEVRHVAGLRVEWRPEAVAALALN